MSPNEKRSLPYVDRDISWMHFNARVLQEVEDKKVPLLERLNFLGIYSNNLDEFFRVRMASDTRLAEMTGKGTHKQAAEARKLVRNINELDAGLAQRFENDIKETRSELAQNNICFLNEKELNDEQQHFVRKYFRKTVSGFLAPLWVSQLKEFSDENDEHIYLAARLSNGVEDPSVALIELPVARTGRFVLLPSADEKQYIMYLDDVIRYCLPMMFPGMGFTSFEAYSFKFTKDSELEIDDDLHEGLLQKVAKAVHNRRKGPTMRVIYDREMPTDLLEKIMKKLKCDKLDTVLPSGRYHNHKDFMSLPPLGRQELKYEPFKAIVPPELKTNNSLIELIQEKDRFIHVPYHTFDYLIRLLQEAAVSKRVKSIKMSLYRVANHSKVVEALICAARNGKKVTAMVELMARFNETSNIDYARRMQDAGVNVIFGMEGLKVHAKLVLIGLRQGRDIAVVSSGNFHEGNAKVYTDYLVFTADKRITKEVDMVFDFIKRPYSPVQFNHLLVSPNEMRNKLYDLIDNEIKDAANGKEAWIKIKINHITDENMVRKLYQASQAGVRIDILVRGCSSLVWPRKGYSENIRAYGIIDRFLEHSRIFIFHAGGEEKTYMGSADWMPRNLNHRIEALMPVYDPDIKADMKKIVELGLADNVKGRIVDGSGRNLYHTESGVEPMRSQSLIYEHYKDLLAADGKVAGVETDSTN